MWLFKTTVIDIKVTSVGGVYCEGDAGFFLLSLWFSLSQKKNIDIL